VLCCYFFNDLFFLDIIRDLVLKAKKCDALFCLNENIVDYIEPEVSLLESSIKFANTISVFGKDRTTYGGLKLRLYTRMCD
jgi:hypothetical protein